MLRAAILFYRIHSSILRRARASKSGVIGVAQFSDIGVPKINRFSKPKLFSFYYYTNTIIQEGVHRFVLRILWQPN